MLDALNDASLVGATAVEHPATPVKKAKRVPIYIWYFAAVAAVVALVILLCVPRVQTTANEGIGVAYEQGLTDTSTIKTVVLSEPEVIPLNASEIELLRKDSTRVEDCKKR